MKPAVGRQAPWTLVIEFGLGTLLLLWPAISEGHLLFAIDTFRHIGWKGGAVVEAPLFYNLWLAPMWFLGQTWLVACSQACLYVGLIALVVRVIARRPRPGFLLGVIGVLALGSYLPFLVSMAMPDVFAAAGLLAVALGFAVTSRLGRIALAAVVWLAALVHYSHLPVFVATWAVCTPLAIWIERRAGAGKRVSWLPTAVALVAALGTQIGATAMIHGRAAYSLAGSVFAVARLIEDGPAARYLEQRCPGAGFRMCELVEDLPVAAQDFLWGSDSFVWRSGGFAAVSDEASQVLRGAVAAYPVQVAAEVGQNTMRQLSWVKAFPDPRAPPDWYLALGQSYPHVAKPLAKPFYFMDHDPPRWSDRFHEAVFGLGALTLLILLPAAWRRGHARAVTFALALLAGIVLNSIIMGGISGTFPRYAARVAWLVPLAAMAMTGLALSADWDESN